MPALQLTDVTRRASLLILGAAGVDAISQSNSAKAKKKGDVNKRCKQQVDPCTIVVTDQCGVDATCIAGAPGCCNKLKTCAFSDFVVCLNALVAGLN